MDAKELLQKYRRILDAIHAHGNIFYDASRMKAYNIIAQMASEYRRAQ